MHLDDQIISFLFHLKFTTPLPESFEVLYPFNDNETQRVCRQFYHKQYNDTNTRFAIVGINPGRFGAGVTGIPFTDPIRLSDACKINNSWPRKQELSSVYMYEMIEAFGGVKAFYNKFYITAISPLGFTKNGKNINYYDNKELENSVTPFAVKCLNTQLSWGLNKEVAFCLGEGKNFKYFSKLNAEHQFFKTIIPLPHPRFIMQYKLRSKQVFIDKYLAAFSSY